MNPDKRLRSLFSALEDHLPLGMTGDFLEFLERAKEPAQTPIVKLFFEEDWGGLGEELDTLTRLDSGAVPRLLGFERDPDDEADYSQRNTRWRRFDAQLWTPSLLPGGITDLRVVSDRMLATAVEGEALVLWLLPIDDAPVGRPIFIYCRDCEQREEIVLYLNGTVRQFWLKDEPIDTFMDRRIYEDGAEMPWPRRLARQLSDPGLRDELGKRLEEKNLTPLTAAQLTVLADYLLAATSIRSVFISEAHEVGTAVLGEAQELLSEYCRYVRDFFEEQSGDIKDALEQMERLHEKRLKGLRSDAEKMRMLAEGAKMRADRVDSENRDLRKRLASGPVEQIRCNPSEPKSKDAAAQGLQSVRDALNALF